MSRTKKGSPPSYPKQAHQSGHARITVRGLVQTRVTEGEPGAFATGVRKCLRR